MADTLSKQQYSRTIINNKSQDEILDVVRKNLSAGTIAIGFVNIISGVESGSPKMLNLLNKRITTELVLAVDEKFSRHSLSKH